MWQKTRYRIFFILASIWFPLHPIGIRAMITSLENADKEEPSTCSSFGKDPLNNALPLQPPLTLKDDQESLKIQKLNDTEIENQFSGYNKARFSSSSIKQKALAQQLYNFYDSKNKLREKLGLPLMEFKAIKEESQETVNNSTLSIDGNITYTLNYKPPKVTKIKNIPSNDLNGILERNFFYIPFALLEQSSFYSSDAQLRPAANKQNNAKTSLERDKGDIFSDKKLIFKFKALDIDDSKLKAIKSSFIKARGILDESQKQLIESYLTYKTLVEHYKGANLLAIKHFEDNIRKQISSQNVNDILAYIEGSDKKLSTKQKNKNRDKAVNQK